MLAMDNFDSGLLDENLGVLGRGSDVHDETGITSDRPAQFTPCCGHIRMLQ
jgi:hypothetical protein